MTYTPNLPRSRNQRGLDPRPVLMRLSSDEMLEIQKIADAECSSLSRIARKLFLDGLAQYKSTVDDVQLHSTNVES